MPLPWINNDHCLLHKIEQMTQGQGDIVIELIDRKIAGINHFRKNELFVNSEIRNIFLVQNYPEIMCRTSLL